MLRGEREPPSAKILPLPFSQVDQGVLQNIRVVLVNTSHPGNIGGAARAMKNMGLSRLVLVDPEEFPSPKALARASGANDLLDNAQVVSTLEEALVGCSLVLGTSARDRRIPWPLLDPRECASKSLEQVALGGEVALVFGREYAGLTNEELQRCQFHVHIPSDPEFGSLNLAQAVILLAYEWSRRSSLAQPPAKELEAPAPHAELEVLISHFEQELERAGYFHPPSRTQATKNTLRTIFTKTSWSSREVKAVRGVLRALVNPARRRD